MKDKIISTMVVLLFMVHPDIATKMFSSFNCMDVDNEKRLIADVVTVCYKG